MGPESIFRIIQLSNFRHYHRESVYDDICFVYNKDTSKLNIFSKSSILFTDADYNTDYIYNSEEGKKLFQNSKNLSLTIEHITDNVIRIKEYNYYLENKEKMPVWNLKALVYKANYHYELSKQPLKNVSPEECVKRIKKGIFGAHNADKQITADADSFKYDNVVTGGMPQTNTNNHQSGKLPGAHPKFEDLAAWLKGKQGGVDLFLVFPQNINDSILIHNLSDLPKPEPHKKRELYIYYHSVDILMIYDEIPQDPNENFYDNWEHIDQEPKAFFQQNAGDIYNKLKFRR